MLKVLNQPKEGELKPQNTVKNETGLWPDKKSCIVIRLEVLISQTFLPLYEPDFKTVRLCVSYDISSEKRRFPLQHVIPELPRAE